ncbi:tautomerase family protein [Bradyrhizobium sp. BR 10289]|uniref:tautomerase family protein n=1 Tax=Bradyrhizobium sp. BR 10289 TaxID=2749993 RepID=UPI001C653802|nr:tautomerase family protein [Bradyrhizobium sp. BR 10289]MBW7970537.1 4-oxalocrotonate tautomerase [Bradyrhizobium sp. BR 10289]
MPTYHCTASIGFLNQPLRAAVAEAITRIHRDITGAPGFFAQVIFHETANGNHFMGGVAASADQIFVHGFIRAGRTATNLRKLVTEIVTSLAGLTGLPTRCIWVYLTEIPANQMAEYGHVLPEPGDEASWLAGLPEEDIRFLKSIGTS